MTWEHVALQDVCEVVGGATPKTGEPDFWGGDIPWVTPADLTNLGGAYISETPRMLTKEGLRSCAAKVLPTDSVLLSSRAPIGHVAINSVPMATNQGFKSLIPNRDRIDEKYLYWWLASNKGALQRLGVGATFKEISKAIVSRVIIPLPPLPEQRRIASILDRVKALEELARKREKAADELAMSLFVSRFGRAREWSARWPAARVDEVAETRLGKMLDKGRQADLEQWPYLRNANVQWMRVELDDILTMGFDEKDRNEFALEPGDVLVCEGGEPGRSAVWQGEISNVYFQKALHRVRLDRVVMLPEFFVWVMRELALSGQLAESITAATIAHLTGVKLKALSLPVPPMVEQLAFVSETEAVRAVKSKNSGLIRAIGQLTTTLGEQAFRGKL